MRSFKILLNSHKVSNLYILMLGVLALSFFISFWLFSRFTVDDAFITWRYGKNLVDYGIWGYNPVQFDLTQAYTNPIFAAIGIVPAYLGLDVVLFFKIISIFTMLGFFLWFSKKGGSVLLCLLFYAVPATVVHAFSGLETFLFVSLMAMLLIYLFEDRLLCAIVVTVFLFLTRPESWLLVLLVPFFALLPKKIDYEVRTLACGSLLNQFSDYKSLCYKKSFQVFLILSIPLSLYFGFHYLYFGKFLPNTFYIKSEGTFQFSEFLWFALFFLPTLPLLAIGKFRLFIVCFVFFGVVAFKYAGSSLAMNYMERFAFHIMAPVYFLMVYVASVCPKKSSKNHQIPFNLGFVKLPSFVIALVIAPFLIFVASTSKVSNLISFSNYYPRILAAHSELGRALHKEGMKNENISSFAFGDAGASAYFSEVVAFDTNGLGSALIASEGFTEEVISRYSPQVIVLYGNPNHAYSGAKGHKELLEWAYKKNFSLQCQIYFRENYTLYIFSQSSLKYIPNVCKSSRKANNRSESALFFDQYATAPWRFWHE